MTRSSQRWDLLEEARRHLGSALKEYDYEPGMQALYGLCKRYPRHDSQEATISKLWLIGRSHAAALERTREPDAHNSPYRPTARRLATGRLDELLGQARKPRPAFSREHCEAAVAVVDYLAGEFHKTTGQWKQSLAAKYVHFHVPTVPKYDSIADGAISALVSRADLSEDERRLWDRAGYARYLARLVCARRRLKKARLGSLSARDLDVFLLYWGTL